MVFSGCSMPSFYQTSSGVNCLKQCLVQMGVRMRENRVILKLHKAGAMLRQPRNMALVIPAPSSEGADLPFVTQNNNIVEFPATIRKIRVAIAMTASPTPDLQQPGIF